MELDTEIKPKVGNGGIHELMSELESDDGLRRRHAREALQRLGTRSGPYLVQGLHHLKAHVRWESAKALRAVKDPRAASALVNALMDESFEVQWLAAEALIALGQEALIPLLEGVVNNYGSVDFRQGAHHVLHDLERKGSLGPRTLLVLDELRAIEPMEPYPVSARRALDALRGKGDLVQDAVHN
jgi:hypothetical protein